MAAPVGVTRSPAMPSSIVGRPCIRIAAAGAGTGRMPCAVLTRPEPSGSGPAVQRAAPISAINRAAATISTIEIDGADFVKGDGVFFDAMHLGFRLGEQRENRDGVFLHTRIEIGAGEVGANIRPCFMADMLVFVMIDANGNDRENDALGRRSAPRHPRPPQSGFRSGRDRDAERACIRPARRVAATRSPLAPAARIPERRREARPRTCRQTSRRADRDECPTNAPMPGRLTDGPTHHTASYAPALEGRK